LTGSSSQIAFKPLPSDDPVQRQPDITLAREQLHWEPKINLNEGLMKTIEYFDGLLGSLGIAVGYPNILWSTNHYYPQEHPHDYPH
jgi:hypothetical protein